MRKWITFLVLMRAVTASAQILPPSPQTITTQDTGTQCATAGTCAEWAVTNAPSYTVQAVAAPTFSGTLTLRTTSDGRTWVTTSFTLLASGALVTTLSAAGSAAISNTGIQRIRVVGTTVSSGAMTMTLTAGTASARGGGSGGGGGTVVGGTCTNQVATALDTSAIPTCTTVTSAYIDTSIPTIAGTNIFTGRQDMSGAASTAPFKSGTSLPATCTAGKDTFFKTDATPGANLYFCTSTNTWSTAGTGFFTAVGPTAARSYTFPDADATVLTSAAAVTVAQGGTGLTAGTSGGIPYFSASGAMTSSGALTVNRLLIGGGAGATPTVLGSTGSTTTVLHGSATLPTFGAVSLTADVSGILPSANGGTANQFFTVSGPTTTARTFTYPDASATVLTSNAAVTVAQGGTGAATLTANGVLYGNGTSAVAATSVGTAGQVLTSNGTGVAPTFQAAGAGTVTSVSVTVPAFLTATGCTITSSGTCAITTTSQNGNLFIASPDGSSGAPIPRAITSNDFPTVLTEVDLSTGTTIAVYGGAYRVGCGSPCTVTLPTVVGHNKATISVRVAAGASAVTFVGTSSQPLCGGLGGCDAGGKTLSGSTSSSMLLVADTGVGGWAILSGYGY